ncbi:surface-adhesin E family protein [Cupriavidus sp. 30B13]|uniref:surface-adhesin E family protein n=1 Tax=Cupriavidus sp. 30B13 TaxID=3384241 RepID=UPI003B90AC4F
MSLRAVFHAVVLLAGGCSCLAAHAEAVRPAAAAGLFQCQGADGGTVFRATPREGCTLVAAPDPGAPDPQRWLPLMGANGAISYFDKTSVRRRGAEVGVAVMRNAPAGVIRTTSGEPIRSSLKRMIFNCATSMYAVVEQTLYSKRYARGESLYTIGAPQAGMPQQATAGTVAGELFNRLCH